MSILNKYLNNVRTSNEEGKLSLDAMNGWSTEDIKKVQEDFHLLGLTARLLLWNRIEIYIIYDDGTEALAESYEELQLRYNQGQLIGIERF